MRTKWQRESTGSLDLFLDTICNTFGCVVLLAILVSILARNKGTQLAKQLETLQLRTQLENLLRRHEELSAAVQGRLALLATFSEEQKTIGKQCAELERRLADLQAQINHLQGPLNRIQDRKNNIAAQLRSTTEEIKQLSQEIQNLQSRLAATATELDFSTERGAGFRRSVSVILRYGRMYVWHKYQHGNRVGLNTDEFVVVERLPDGILTKPKPYAGIPLREAGAAQRIRQRLVKFDPADCFLDVAVWPDSFDCFRLFRKTIKEMGFEFRLVVMPEGTKLLDRGARDAQVL